MKSLMLGVYKKQGICTSKIRDCFSMQGQRKINSFKNQSIELYYTSESELSFIGSNFTILFSGNPIFEEDSEKFFAAFNENQIEKELVKVSGIFSFCYFNKINNSLIVANDFFGLYPIFVYEDKSAFIFCNEYQPILEYSVKLKKLNKIAINEYFKYGFVIGRKTFFKKIDNLSPRSIVEIKKKSSNYKLYPEFKPIEEVKTENEYLDLLHEALRKSHQNYFQNNKPLSITLTGGLDSRFILALSNTEEKQSSKFICFFLEPLNESNDKDVMIAKILAREYNLELEIVNNIDKTEELSSGYFESLRPNNNPSVLTGLYGGELLSGQLYRNVIPAEYQLINNKNLLKNIFSKKKSMNKHKIDGKRNVYFEAMMSSFFTSIYSGTEGSWVHPWSNHLRYHSIYSDTNFLKIWFSIPDSILYGNTNFTFKLYQKFFPDFMKVPTNSTATGLKEAGFYYFEEGIEPKTVKKLKYNKGIENLKTYNGYKHIPRKYKLKLNEKNEQQRQRVIDFTFWYSYINTLAE